MMGQLSLWFTWALIGFFLILIVEGLIYAIFPEKMKELLTRMIELPAATMRSAGLIAAVGGGIGLWLLRTF